MNFRLDFSISAKQTIGILLEILLDQYITLSSLDTLTILSLPTHEYGMCSIYLYLILNFLIYRFLFFLSSLNVLAYWRLAFRVSDEKYTTNLIKVPLVCDKLLICYRFEDSILVCLTKIWL